MSSPPGPSDFGVDRFTVADVLDRRAAQHPDRVMLSVAGVDVTFEDLRLGSCAAASMLTDLGVDRGDTVALFTATCPEWIYFWLGAARIGAVSAAVNAANKGDFLLHTLRLSRAKVILTDPERQHRIEDIADRLDTLNEIVVLGDSLSAALNRDAGRPPQDGLGAAEVGSLFFTSGTTGPSKAVATSWHYLFTVAATVTSAWRFAPKEVIWTAMPLFHLSAAPIVLAPMLVGGTTVLAREFHPSEVWDEVRGHSAVGFVGAGAMVSMLQNLPPDPRDAELPLRFISAAPISANAFRDIEKRYGCRVVTMYGLTEAFPLTVTGVADDGVAGTSGKPIPNFEVRIVDDTGNPLPAGEVGEIICRPRYPHVMSAGYVSQEAPEAPGLPVDPHQDWFNTADLGRFDNEQNLTYVDRIKDSLRRRGENISSVEVETVVTGHPAVLEAAAVGVPSDVGEDDILLLVTIRPGAVIDCAELLDFCADRMPHFCVPRFVETVDELPKNGIGRIRKDLLRARGLTPAAWDRERHGHQVSR
ncbi:AMP-binding protein [Mycobacterium pseudokansasii]|uniref:AMP-binding protein n=1 Tax=Mycobacterium pseudokansasii TaxID=2341080 RepID=UPI0007B5340F|nr:AMP-binding protein [Mycobacterium pseudokansasii]KZS65562.1 ATP-dependent acyl-CoA ligase [Mycobacterium kansasii]VAZ98625.1 putative crotonobetaine/carnitine-CoA ligase [Mycobacterium pseudokansasii]VBA29788.1 putative crotonobetaine/carnitine-CoA ligase [Mycobacterium pseudokansasii]